MSVKHLEIQEEKEALKEYGSSSSGASIGDIIGAALDENTKKKPEDLENEKNDFLNHYFEKRKSLIFRYFLAFLLIIFAFWILIDKSSSENFIAKIYLNGVINDRSSLIKKINKLKEDSKVKGLLLVTNSPGGTFVSSKEIFDTLKRISEKIPTATYIREIGTSGAYLASLGTDRIFVNYGSITGSIGVILQTANLKNLFRKSWY